MNLGQLKALFTEAGARKLYAKRLAENDNSKNQIYFAGAVETLNVFPSRQVFAENTSKGPSFKALLNFGWLTESGDVAPAPRAQLILYSQYPEVRFSGFLQGCSAGPSELMMSRDRARRSGPDVIRRLVGRVLFLAVTNRDTVLGYVAAGNSEVVAEFNSVQFAPAFDVFREVPLPNLPTDENSQQHLLKELQRIHRLGWIDSKQLGLDGAVRPCVAPQCGGFTLEAELGIAKNSASEPDFLGWEIKQHAVTRFDRPDSAAPITLMTPEPTGGFYTEQGVEAFVRKFGYVDQNNRPDRMNFGGIHRAGHRQPSTGLTMRLTGYNIEAKRIIDANGALALVNDEGIVAASWAFSGLFAHWSRKHTKAAYVPSMRRQEPRWQYSFGPSIRLAHRTDSLRLLAALANGEVYYDPGIKVENLSTKPTVKRRSQFRIASKMISVLYESVMRIQV